MPHYRDVSGAYSSTLGDVDDDGDPDLVVGMYESAFDVVLNDGSGTFAPQALTYLIPEASRATDGLDGIDSVAIGDWDGDGHVDLALAMSSEINNPTVPKGIYVADGNGDGTFTPDGEPPLLSQSMRPSAISALRLNSDSYDDVAVTMYDNTGNQGDNIFTLVGGASGLVPNPASGGSTQAGADTYQQAVADLDGDGLKDIVVGMRGARKLATLRNVGDGSITAFPGSPFNLGPIDGKNFSGNAVYSGDFNGDATTDLAVDGSHSGDPNQARGIHLLISRPNASADPASINFGSVQPGQSSSPQTVTIANDGAAAAQPDEAPTITGDDAGDFALGATTCGGGQLDGGDSCTQQITFAPDAIGPKTASLVYAMDNQDDVVVPLSGSAGVPGISVSPTSQDRTSANSTWECRSR